MKKDMFKVTLTNYLKFSHAFILCVRQGYEELERQLKEVFKERSNILHQLLKTSKELQGIKVNLQVRLCQFLEDYLLTSTFSYWCLLITKNVSF